jgi:2-succinyl-6-hydroxy-2,4-cyclohexadiene-1-carboxylate synthase
MFSADRLPLWGLHGFLGRENDWQHCPEVHPIDLWKEPQLPLKKWAKEFNCRHSGLIAGYSLGGRLALHALLDNPKQWKRAWIISAHPGLPSDQKEARRAHDSRWAERFLHEEWHSLMVAWDSQPLLGNHIERSASDYDRQALASALQIWSLGEQEELHEQIAALPMPIVWIVGEHDDKFRAETAKMHFSHPDSRVVIIPGGKHRLLDNCEFHNFFNKSL